LILLVSYFGSPSSGKTTIACSLFSQLKLSSTNSELILEEARKYISNYRRINNLLPNSPIILSDQDQVEIAKKQLNIEKDFKHSCGPNTIIISDSSVFNSLLYMSDELVKVKGLENYFLNELKDHYDLIFYCHSVDQEYLPTDSNRIHSKDEFKKIEEKAEKLIKLIQDRTNTQVVHLLNDADMRIKEAYVSTMHKYCKVLETTPNSAFEVLPSKF
jgi:adenylate kinase family enzyme